MTPLKGSSLLKLFIKARREGRLTHHSQRISPEHRRNKRRKLKTLGSPVFDVAPVCKELPEALGMEI